MDEELVNIAEKSAFQAEDSQIAYSESSKTRKELTLLNTLEEAGKKITAKSFALVKTMNSQGNLLNNLAFCILSYFSQDIPRNFLWEPVSKLFSNPSSLLLKIRGSAEIAKTKKIEENSVREMQKKLKTIQISDLESQKISKELENFFEFFQGFCEFYIELWPNTLAEPEPKKKFKIPLSKKNLEEHEMIKKINQEKRLLQELRFQEKKIKWEEERAVKNEIKQELLRDMQREIMYKKNLEDEFKKKQSRNLK